MIGLLSPLRAKVAALEHQGGGLALSRARMLLAEVEAFTVKPPKTKRERKTIAENLAFRVNEILKT